MPMKTDKIIVVCILVFTAVYWYAIHQIKEPLIGDPIGPRAIPKLLAIGLLISAALLSIEIWTKSRLAAKETTPNSNSLPDKSAPLIARLVGGTLVYFWVFNFLGYAIATSVYLAGLMIYFNPRKTRTNLLTAVIFSFGSYLVFTKLFGAQLPAGFLPF
jgi:putative tricarboxylic transport membrane protein